MRVLFSQSGQSGRSDRSSRSNQSGLSDLYPFLSIPEIVFFRSSAWYTYASSYMAVLHGDILGLVETYANLRFVYKDIPELHVLNRLLVSTLQYESRC